jgi:ABC-type antimicrobial peptide transport system permease subunit
VSVTWSKPAWRDLWEGIRAQPARVGLSFFSLAIGIVALTILIAVLGGLQAKAQRIMQELGANVIAMEPADTEAPFVERQIRVVESGLTGCAVSRVREQMITLDPDIGVSLVQTDHLLLGVRQWRMVEGRFLDRKDIVNRERHAVISRSLADQEHFHVGSVIPVAGISLRVVGIVDTGEGPAEQDAEAGSVGQHRLFTPWTVYLPVQSAYGVLPVFEASALYVRLASAARMNDVMARAGRLLSAPDVRTTLQWTTPEKLIAEVRKLQRTIKLSAGSVTLLCMILGGTTLMSLMLANVRDRVREIGLRRSLGARSLDIAILFVSESCVITGTASVAGTLAAGLALVIGRDQLQVPLVLGASTFLTPALASIALGCIFSYWPARIAARISPALALRNE